MLNDDPVKPAPAELVKPDDWRPARFMLIAAHPDDADFGPAATAARWIDAGSVGWLVCCTSGDQGGEDPDADPVALAQLREREQRAAAGIEAAGWRVIGSMPSPVLGGRGAVEALIHARHAS